MAGFDLQPVLTGDLVTIAPMRADEFADHLAVAADPLLWAAHPAPDRWQEPVFRAYFDDNLSTGGALTIRDRTSGSVIGHSRYDLRKVEPGEVEIGGTFLARHCWGGAYNADVKRLMVGHALAHFDRVVFYVGEANVRSRRAVEKLGAQLLPDRTETFTMSGVPTRHVVYALATRI